MKILILSHFNPWYGPKIFLQAPESLENGKFEAIPSLMDLYEKGFFVHNFREFKSANLIFEIKSEFTRGQRELLLISIIIDNKSDINLNLSKELLDGFVEELKNIPNAFKGFYVGSDVYEGDPQILNKIKSIFYTFFEYFPKESIVIKRKEAKIFIFGLSKAGKTTIIRSLQNKNNKQTFPTKNVNISRTLLNNISIVTYDAPGQSQLHNLWKPFLKNQDGLVFVVDISNMDKLDKARIILHKYAKLPNLKDLPILVLLNKIDIVKNYESKEKFYIDKLKLEDLNSRPIKYFFTSGLEKIGLKDAFNWLTSKFSEDITQENPVDLGLIFSRWDDDEGLKIIAFYPNNAFEDPEIIAIRCFSISQFVFGEGKIKKVSFILPFTHLNAKAAIYFDSIPDKSIRGGQMPLSLVAFYNERIPRAIIQKFQNTIFELFDLIKEHFDDRTKILADLKKLHQKILKQLSSYKPSVKALRLAELRYQELFKAARDAILIIDKKTGLIIDANQQARKLLLLSPEEIITMHASQIKLGDKSKDFKKQIFNQIKKEGTPPLSFNIENSKGKLIPIEVNANELNMEGKKFIQCIIRDITERNRSEDALRDALKRYKQAYSSANFYKDLFTHDMNNILNNIQSSVELFSLYINNPYKLENIREISDIIRDQVIRGAKLVLNVRKLSKIEDKEIELKKIEITSILENLIVQIQEKFHDKNINISITELKEDRYVIGNELLFDIFENILINSIKYNENDVIDIFIKISNVKREDKNMMLFEIIDNGIGIPDDRKEIIFSGNVKRGKGGRGMDVGLILVKKVVEKFNGNIWVEDKVTGDYAKGCKFIVLLERGKRLQ